MSLLRYKAPSTIADKTVKRMNGTAYTAEDEVIYTQFEYKKPANTIDI